MPILARLFVVMLLVAPLSAWAAPPSPGQFAHSGWTRREGVPGTVQALAQTPDGYLWIGTYEGLFRFDGVSFEPIAPAPGHPPGSIPVTALFTARNGDLWIGYAGGAGVELRRGNRMIRGGMLNPPGEITQFVEDAEGGIWAVGGRTRRSLKRYWDGKWSLIDKHWGMPDDQEVASLFVDHRGIVWAATEQHLLFLRPGTRRFVATPMRIANGGSMAEDAAKRLWLSDPLGTRMVPDYAAGETIAASRIVYPFRGPMRRTTILFDSDGSLWGSTYTGGVFRIPLPGTSPADAISYFRTENGLTSNQAVATLKDREGNIWAATELGIDQFRQAPIEHVALPAQTSAYGYTIAVDSIGDVYISSGSTLYRARAGGEPEPILNGYEGQALCQGRGGALWFAVPGQVLRLEGGKVVRSVPVSGKAIASGCGEVERGQLWLARQAPGLLRYDGRQWNKVEFLTDYRGPRDIVVPWRGMLVATLGRRSVVLVDGGRSRTLSFDEIGVSGLTAIHGSHSGLLIAGGTGLARFDGRRFQRLTIADHPWIRGLRGIVETQGGETWFLNSKGIIRLKTADLDRAFADPHRPIRHILFDEQDGYSSRPQNTDGLQTVVGGDGRLWFLTRQGVLRVDPARLSTNPSPPPVAIRALTADGRRFENPQDLRLSAGVRSLSIDYTALSVTVPSRVSFRYRLTGVDSEWIDPGSRRQAFYTNLAPGTYHFQVIAANNDGVWNRAGATLTFTVPPTFIQSRAFVLLCVLIGAGALWLIYQQRLRAISRRMRAGMAERLSERERIARELHDTLLQGVQALVLRFQLAADDIAPNHPSRRAIEDALDRADDVLAEGRDRVRNLRMTESDDNLERTINDIVEQMVFPPGVSVQVRAEGGPRRLSPLVTDEIRRIANEALFNIWRHAHAKQVEVDILFRRTALKIRFRDDGIGIPAAVLQQGRRDGHFGLPGMRERARKIHGEIGIRSGTSGTEVTLTVPAAYAYASNASRRLKRLMGGELV